MAHHSNSPTNSSSSHFHHTPTAQHHSHHTTQHHATHHTTTQHVASHRRSVSGACKKPTRPAFKRVSSGANIKHKKVSIDDTPQVDSDEEEDMSSTFFPQYCTVCEKQIHNPCPSILYCSEKCRRKDTNKPLSDSLEGTSPPPSSTMFPSDDTIVPRKSPTLVSNRFSFASVSDNEGEGDQDADYPTSHPVSPQVSQPSSHPRAKSYRDDSEAAKYLRQFQSPSFTTSLTGRIPRRPKAISRASTGSLATTTPSLVHSDTSGAASLENSPSASTLTMPYSTSAAGSYLAGFASAPYSYGKPLPPRTNPAFTPGGSLRDRHALVTPSKTISVLSESLREERQREEAIRTDNLLPGFKSAPSISMDVGAASLPTIVHDRDDSNDVERIGFEKVSIVGSCGAERSRGGLQSMFALKKMQEEVASSM